MLLVPNGLAGYGVWPDPVTRDCSRRLRTAARAAGEARTRAVSDRPAKSSSFIALASVWLAFQ